MNKIKVSERKHWDDYWDSCPDIDEVYSNEGRVSDRLIDMISMEGMIVLEVGAGTGRDSAALSRHGAFVVPLDYSHSSLRMISSQLEKGSRISPCCGDAFALPFRDGKFDIVFHQGLLEHFRNPLDLLAENYRVLKPGGYLLVDVPQKYHYYTVVKHLMIAIGKWFAGWETEYTVAELENLLEKKSFSIISSYGEWLSPPIWYRMMRKLFVSSGLKLPMYPAIFTFISRMFRGFRRWILKHRWSMYTTLVIGTIAQRREVEEDID